VPSSKVNPVFPYVDRQSMVLLSYPAAQGPRWIIAARGPWWTVFRWTAITNCFFIDSLLAFDFALKHAVAAFASAPSRYIS
jgi:hypothetical protein